MIVAEKEPLQDLEILSPAARLARVISDTAIAAMAREYMPLTISGIDDKDGFSRVHEARMTVKNRRVDVEKCRKELKADALEYGRKVDAEAKRLTAMLEPIESHLEGEERRIQDAKDAIKNAERLKREAEEKARREAEEAAMRAEQQRLAAERAKLEAERAEMEAEKRRLEQIEVDRRRAEELERAKAEAAERAKRETEARIAREQAEAKARADAAEAAWIKAEAMRPDREKLESVADRVECIDVPRVSPEAAEAARKIAEGITQFAGWIRGIAEHLGK